MPPVLVFHGEEPFLARLGVDLLRKHVLAPGSEAFDFVSLAGKEATADVIAAHASTMPMLSPKRLAVVYDFQHMNPSERTKLLSYVRNPVESSCVALVSYERLSGAKRFERDICAAAAVVECGRPPADVLVALARRMAEERGKAIDEEALSVLVDWTGGELTAIANELDKLACFAEDRETIVVADVEQVVGAKARGLRDLAAAIAERKMGDALGLVDELREGGIDPAQLVSQLYGFWVAMWLARSGPGGRPAGGGFRGRSLMSSVPNAGELVGRRSSREYARGIAQFYRADVDIRRGMPAGPTVGLLVYDLVKGAGGA